MQIDRLFQIVLILLNKKTITAKKLSEHFNVSIRTIYRDIEALSFAGIPIYSLRGKNGGIKLLESYVLDKSLLSSKEQNEILYALESLKASNYPNVDEVLKKLNLIFNKSSNYWIEVDFSRYGSNDNTLFNNIKKAILNSQAVKFTYFNTNGETSQRTVNPLKIWFKEKAWYLFAYCQKKNEIRQFKINRIKNLTLTNEYFERRSINYNINSNDNDISKKIVKIIVEVDKSQAYRVYDEFSEENISKAENGNFKVIMENYENEWLYGYLLSFGEHLKIIAPERIKNILSHKIEQMKKNYL
ncbi:helix-turn-helix transcriptional regulator [Leptotrichia sp. HSP-536]|uniref:Helix-turn-helix transcriptional regulator n=1 Tax=Leptotrichia alba TaxID=3239304 RepID=A0AB39V7T6_9FUSO